MSRYCPEAALFLSCGSPAFVYPKFNIVIFHFANIENRTPCTPKQSPELFCYWLYLPLLLCGFFMLGV